MRKRNGMEARCETERESAMKMLKQTLKDRPITIGGDKGFDTRELVRQCRQHGFTHVVQNTARRGGCAIDERTTGHGDYEVSQCKRKLIEPFKIAMLSKKSIAGAGAKQRFQESDATWYRGFFNRLLAHSARDVRAWLCGQARARSTRTPPRWPFH